jgi:hypothetical protein
MRTSLNELQQIEDFLFRVKNNGDTALYEVRLALQPALRENMEWQQKTYSIIQDYSRMQLKAEIAHVHQQLFRTTANKGFRQSILRLFSRK